MPEPINTITCQELHDRLQESSALVVINVLDEAYYRDCHIPGSINIPVDQLSESVEDWNRNLDIVVYCAHEACEASKDAYRTLERLGFANVRAFEEGMRGWIKAGLPVEGPCQKTYLT